MSRSTLKAGTMRAGDNLADDVPLAELLTPRTVPEADAALALIGARLADAEAAAAAHAANRDDALLACTETDHDAQARQLADDARRLAVAAERITARREELAAAERLADGERHAQAATAHAERAERLVGEYATAARKVADLLEAIAAECASLVRERDAAHAAGAECMARLPHETRFRPARYEEKEVVTRQRPPGVYNAAGHRLDGNGDAQEIVSRHLERVCVDAGRRAPDLTRARALLPDPEGGAILDRGEA